MTLVKLTKTVQTYNHIKSQIRTLTNDNNGSRTTSCRWGIHICTPIGVCSFWLGSAIASERQTPLIEDHFVATREHMTIPGWPDEALGHHVCRRDALSIRPATMDNDVDAGGLLGAIAPGHGRHVLPRVQQLHEACVPGR